MKKSMLTVIAPAVALLTILSTTNAIAELKNNKDKTLSCAGCHGEDGNSLMPMFPKLANQNEEYLIKQLQAFKENKRFNATMNNAVANLGVTDIKDIAIFYEQQTITPNELPALDYDDDEDLGAEQLALNKQAAEIEQQKLILLGKDVYRNGDLEREISACIACHGPSGEGNKPASFPALKGQHADYLMKTLNDFKAGIRSNNADNMMHMIAKKMTDDEIKGTSYYISIMK